MSSILDILGVARAAPLIELTDDERDLLESWVPKTTTEQRLSRRARMILDAAARKMTTEIAASLHVSEATAGGWRTRVGRDRVAGLMDAPRSGEPAVYHETTETRILKKLDGRPREGQTAWTGSLVAKALGSVFTI